MTTFLSSQISGLSSLFEELSVEQQSLQYLNRFLSELTVEIDIPELERKDLVLCFHGSSLKIATKQAVEDMSNCSGKTIICESAAIKVAKGTAEMLGKADGHILIQGETGTGKDLFANFIHCQNSRDQQAFVWLPCATLTEQNIEPECRAYFASAQSGTLYLDEIEDLNSAKQLSLLNLLENEFPLNFQLITASSKDLAQLVKQQKFSSRLLDFIHQGYIALPPLRERREDIQPLANHYLAELCKKHQLSPKTLSSEYLESLQHYPWPGNIRELINALEQSIITAKNQPTLFARHLPTNIRIHTHKYSAKFKQGI